MGFKTKENLQFFFGCGISGFGDPLYFLNLLVDRFQIFQLEFVVNDFFIKNRIYATRNVYNVGIVETTDHMDDGIHFPDIGQEFISQSFSFAGSFYQTGDVHNLDDGGHNPLRFHDFFQSIETLIGNGNDAHIGIDGAERIVGSFRFGAGKCVKKGGFANIRQSHNTTL